MLVNPTSWFSRKWRAGVFRKLVFPPFGRGFSRHQGLPIRWGLDGAQRCVRTPQPHRLDEPAKLSLGRVASQQSPLPFHLAKSF